MTGRRSSPSSSPPKDKKIKKNDSPPSSPSPLVYIVGLAASVVVAVLLTHLVASSPISPLPFSLPSPSPLSLSDRLSSASLLLEDSVYGPECIAEHPSNGRLWTGLRTGLICEVEVDKSGKSAKILRAVRLSTAENCDGSYASFPKCGRPLGLRFSPEGTLLVADAYLGLHEIDLEKESVSVLVRGGSPLEGSVPLRYLNDVDVLPDGRLVLSESSTRFDDRDFIYDLMEHRPSGRLLIFNRTSDSLRVLASGLFFPNGIAVRSGKVLVAEMGAARILKYSPSADTMDIFVDNLPGYPDNIRKTKVGRQLLVPLAAGRGAADNWLAERPSLRQLITKLLSRAALEWLMNLVTDDRGIVLKVDAESGRILEAMGDSTGRVTGISTALQLADRSIVLGSDSGYYIGRVPPISGEE